MAKMPAKTQKLTEEARQKKIDAAIATLTTLLPGGGAAAAASKGTKAVLAKEQEAMRWKTGKKSKTVALKKGGSVKKRTKSGGVRKVRT
jgi:hypothetical protein